MTIEFINTSNKRELKEYTTQVESLPEWSQVLVVRESARRLIGFRGRLFGEAKTDFEDLEYDINSYRRIGLPMDQIQSAVQTLSAVESSYFGFTEKLAFWFANTSGYPHRREDYVDVAKDIVSWQVWYRWKPDNSPSLNGLYNSVMGALHYIPYKTHKAYLENIPLSHTFEGSDDRGNKVTFHEHSIREMPEYRLRRVVGNLPLENIFSRLAELPNKERLSILSVMGYIQGVENMTQALKRFGVDTESFRSAFDRGLDRFNIIAPNSPVDAYELIETSLNLGLIKDHNGKSAFFDSPRLKLLELVVPPNLDKVNVDVFELARTLENGQFKYSLEEIGKLTGLTKAAVAHRIPRILEASKR